MSAGDRMWRYSRSSGIYSRIEEVYSRIARIYSRMDQLYSRLADLLSFGWALFSDSQYLLSVKMGRAWPMPAGGYCSVAPAKLVAGFILGQGVNTLG